MAQTQPHASIEKPDEELSEISLEDPPVAPAIPADKVSSETKDDESASAARHTKAPEGSLTGPENDADDQSDAKTKRNSIPESTSRRSSLTLGISVSPAVAALPPISPAAQAVKQRQEALDASNAPASDLAPTTTPPGPAVIPAFPAPAAPDGPSTSDSSTVHPTTDADRFGYPAPGSLMVGQQTPPVVAIQNPVGEENGVLKFGKPVAPGGGLLPEGDLQDTVDIDEGSLSGKFDKVDLSDETGYQKGLAMLEQGKMPTPDMMSPQEWVAFQQQRGSGLGKKHPTAQPGLGKEQQEGGWFQGVTPYAKEVGRTFGRLASSVENQITTAYRKGERRRDRMFAMIESSQQAAAVTPEIFEAFWRKHFNAPPEEELEIAYACSLNTEAGPVPGVIYQSNRSIAFSSDKPVAYPTVDGHSEQATYKLMVPWVEVTGLEGIRSQPLVQERYIKVAMANGDELWFLRFKDYNRGLTGMQGGLKDFQSGSTEPSPRETPEISKPDSKPPSRSATPPLPNPKTARSNSRGREQAPPQEENLQETYTVRVHEAIEKARNSSSEHLPGVGSRQTTATEPRPMKTPGPAESSKQADENGGRKSETLPVGKAGVPVEKPGGGDVLDVGQKEKVELPGVPGGTAGVPVEKAGGGDILDVGEREKVELAGKPGVKVGVPVEKPGGGDILDVGQREKVELPGSPGVKAGVPVEKPGGGDILDVGQKEKVQLPGAPEGPQVKSPGAGDILDAGAREDVSLPKVGSSERNGSESTKRKEGSEAAERGT